VRAAHTVCTQDGYTALARAASQGHVDAIKVLLELGADIEKGDEVRVQ
jgi:ankyrin repeat protein